MQPGEPAHRVIHVGPRMAFLNVCNDAAVSLVFHLNTILHLVR